MKKQLILKWWDDGKGQIRHECYQEGFNEHEITGLIGQAWFEAQIKLKEATKESCEMTEL